MREAGTDYGANTRAHRHTGPRTLSLVIEILSKVRQEKTNAVASNYISGIEAIKEKKIILHSIGFDENMYKIL